MLSEKKKRGHFLHGIHGSFLSICLVRQWFIFQK